MPWSEDEERQIELSLEVKRRERREIAKESADAACARGEHCFEDGKCSNCGADKPSEEPPKKKVFNPIE